MLCLDHSYQNSSSHLQTIQEILILLCQCVSLWNYCRDEVNDYANENIETNHFRINKNKTATSKYLSIRQN